MLESQQLYHINGILQQAQFNSICRKEKEELATTLFSEIRKLITKPPSKITAKVLLKRISVLEGLYQTIQNNRFLKKLAESNSLDETIKKFWSSSLKILLKENDKKKQRPLQDCLVMLESSLTLGSIGKKKFIKKGLQLLDELLKRENHFFSVPISLVLKISTLTKRFFADDAKNPALICVEHTEQNQTICDTLLLRSTSCFFDRAIGNAITKSKGENASFEVMELNPEAFKNYYALANQGEIAIANKQFSELIELFAFLIRFSVKKELLSHCLKKINELQTEFKLYHLDEALGVKILKNDLHLPAFAQFFTFPIAANEIKEIDLTAFEEISEPFIHSISNLIGQTVHIKIQFQKHFLSKDWKKLSKKFNFQEATLYFNKNHNSIKETELELDFCEVDLDFKTPRPVSLCLENVRFLKPFVIEKFVGDYGSRITSANFSSTELSDASLANIFSSLTNLKNLNLSLCKNLGNLSLDAMAANLRQLESLDLSTPRINFLQDEKLIPILENNQELKVLKLNLQSRITSASILAIAEFLPKLEVLEITSLRQVSLESVSKVAENCLNLKKLNMNFPSQKNSHSEADVASFENWLKRLAKKKKLKALSFAGIFNSLYRFKPSLLKEISESRKRKNLQLEIFSDYLGASERERKLTQIKYPHLTFAFR